MTIHVLTNFHKKGCWILKTESHLSNNANKLMVFLIMVLKSRNYLEKNKTKDGKFDARCVLKSINKYLGLRKK